MSAFPELYPPRDRATNIALIKNLLEARSQEEFETADKRIAKKLHPSLLAELDWMEMTMPAPQQEEGAHLVDGLFLHHLPAIMAQRRVEFDLPEAELRWEVAANIGFYQKLIQEGRHLREGLGDGVSRRIGDCLQGLEPDVDGVMSRLAQAERPRIHREFSGVEDPDWIPTMVDVEIRNAMAKALDHVSSRMQAKHFLRTIGGRVPDMEIPSIQSEADLNLLLERLGSLEAVAREFSVHQLAAVCTVLRELLAGLDVSRLTGFGGELAAGYGPCGTCAMMYASSAMVSYDPTCPRLFEGEDEQIYLPIDFNVSVCPFCGAEARAEAPSMFYSPRRNLVIYNCPRLGQFSEAQAREVHRPMLVALRQRYLDRISDAEAARFEDANEEFTYSAAEFLMAIQMGTTVREEHVYNLVRFHEGRGLIVDPTKGVMIGLTSAEMDRQWDATRTVDLDTVVAEMGKGPAMKEAMAAFAAGQYERCRDSLEALLQRHPEDTYIRRNLAAVYVTLGDKESAKRVLGG